ncbi:hypothetical protein DSC45_21160 [Streptomyces sp. YIM 130001]|uniref:DUF5993 family protein n=1 Tax=Streptomyces sp. YIM 130001 TaxID=2259644 RepID=UPI000ED49A12|nr:DUF5993 family protein [Streptomyces sp. YIM 130001]RII14199.1 hypothetical protein DSC45_21160 [Streptomyces sp. YIM 130001]
MGNGSPPGVLLLGPAARSVPSARMDTLIFGGLLATWLVLYRRRSRNVLLVVWWVVFAATLVLLSHHITSSLGLGLNY